MAKGGTPIKSGQLFNCGGRPICDYCNRSVHVRSPCYKLHVRLAQDSTHQQHLTWEGSPEVVDRSMPAKEPNNNTSREGSARSGSNYFQQGARSSQANAVHYGAPSSSEAGSSKSAQQYPVLPFSEAQIQKLLSMVGSDDDPDQLTGNNFDFILCVNDWIIDTGASRHMIGCGKFLSDAVSIDGSAPVFIPNGASLLATLYSNECVARPRKAN
ncbi:hypothetical protein CRG98_000544 [Punica granatum]|uniref:Uncharacterized protein n=1 Tax=Punica granatum TaxID=22663 RepID=A0A2I0LEF9_PUNGR|nr:hypothetical protein CRG98_000544 [Punica granatum]